MSASEPAGAPAADGIDGPLAALLGDLPVDVFVRRYYALLPHAAPGGGRHLAARGSWDVLERLVATPGADVLVAREGALREGGAGGRGARDLLEAGWTVGVRHAERHDAGLRALAEGLVGDLGGRADVHVYATPPGAHGFGWHYDAEEVFVLETEGVKTFRLRKNTHHPLPLVETLPERMAYEDEGSPLALDCRLEPGDTLYVPSGYWHRVEAEETALSVAIGVLAPSAADVLAFLRRRLPATSVFWRQRLPVAGAAAPGGPAAARAAHRALFADLGRALAAALEDPALADAFLAATDATGREPPSPSSVSQASRGA